MVDDDASIRYVNAYEYDEHHVFHIVCEDSRQSTHAKKRKTTSSSALLSPDMCRYEFCINLVDVPIRCAAIAQAVEERKEEKKTNEVYSK